MKQTINNQFRVITSSLRRLPDFIIIGAQKGGTSSMFSYLEQHPQLKLSIKKEIHFFDCNYLNSLNWYRSHFPLKWIHSNKKTGEASPYYLFHPLAAQRVFQHCPEVKIIVLLRNPVDRAYSHYMMQSKRKVDPLPTFEEAIAAEKDRLNGELEKIISNPGYVSYNHQRLSYLSRGMYYQQLTEWFKYFPIDQFLIIKSESFFENPQDELLKVYKFLDINSRFPLDLSPDNTNTYSPMLEETRISLNKYFKDENNKLSELLGGDFQWE